MRANVAPAAYLTALLLTALGVAGTHALFSRLLLYASYWWFNPLFGSSSDTGLQVLFLLAPLPAAGVAAFLLRRDGGWAFLVGGALLVHGLVRVIDAAATMELSRAVVQPSDLYWLYLSMVYGVLAGLGALGGLVWQCRVLGARRPRFSFAGRNQ
ncbi:MAG TPA: hypothetical protein VF276_13680 [Chloroflexia bacterium]